MSKINYERVLKQLIIEYPHDLDKIETVINDAREERSKAKIDLSTIIESSIWSKDEKIKLLRINKYNPYDETIEKNEGNCSKKCNTFVHLISNNLLNSFEACIEVFYDYEESYVGHRIDRVDAFIRIINMIYIHTINNDEKRKSFLNIAINTAPESLLIKALKTDYIGSTVEELTNESIFPIVIASKDISLINKCAKYVDDISYYLPNAVKTGDKAVVNCLIKNGADVNYIYPERIINWITPIKTAIQNNDYEMYMFLKEKGAKIDIKIDDPDFETKITDWRIPLITLNYNAQEKLKNHREYVDKLKFNRCSSNLKYATSLDSKEPIVDSWSPNAFMINYLSSPLKTEQDEITWESERIAIIDDIFDSTKDKKNVDFTELLISALISRNIAYFNKYATYVIQNKIFTSLDDIIDAFYNLKLNENRDMYQAFIEFLKKYKQKEMSFIMLLQRYYQNFVSSKKTKLVMNDFLREVLNNMTEKERLTTPLIVYAKDLKTVEELTKYGYDITQVDKDQNNILYHLLCTRESTEELNFQELELFYYLLDKVDLSNANKDEKTVLYYMMRLFDTKDEFQNANREKMGPKNNLETVTSRIIDKMPKCDVCTPDISKILDSRIESHIGYPGGWINIEYVYQHHKDLFDSLVKKGFPFSDAFYANLFSSLFGPEAKERNLDKRIDMDATKKYVFEVLDRNTKVQKLDIMSEYEELSDYLENEQPTFEEFARRFIDFNNHIEDLKSFFKENISQRYDIAKYLEYAKEQYNTTYDGLDDILLSMIIKIILKFPKEDINTILSLAPNYDINYVTKDLVTDYAYWRYENQIYNCNYDYNRAREIVEVTEKTEDNRFEAEKYRFTDGANNKFILDGGLSQFAIFTNNISMLKKLVAAGANIRYIVDGEDHSFDYVNSREVLKYIESILGVREYKEFSSKDKEYYLSLVGKNTNNEKNPQ